MRKITTLITVVGDFLVNGDCEEVIELAGEKFIPEVFKVEIL